ncbi:MAG TPA: FlgD immunoglobulin-like domain containing protein [bacterium]|nr:FlgD immunoglobulin-like domain containing protein [bacterium]
MMKLLLVLFPVALFAQVQVDTVIRVPHSSAQGCGLGTAAYLPELNKLYVASDTGRYYVVDCSTYQVVDSISVQTYGYVYYAWNWRRHKLYTLCRNTSDSTLVIDAAADTVIHWLHVCYDMPSHVYLSDVDQLYKAAVETLYAFDGATDTVVSRLALGGLSTNASWDSADQKLYVGQGGDKKLYVYDYVADSVLKVIDVSRVSGVQPDALLFDNTCHKAYLAPFQGEPGPSNVGIIDTERDTLVGTVPVRIWGGLYNTQVAVDERDNKIYLADRGTDWHTPDTLWVVDCATDSVLRKIEYEQQGGGAYVTCWVPWSDRLYLTLAAGDSSYIRVLDCKTDSFIGTRVLPNNWNIQDIQLDPVRRRMFVVAVDRDYVYVLHDTGYGIAEVNRAGPRPSSGWQVRTMSGWFDVRYSLASPCRVALSVYDLTGREVKRLVAEEQSAGQHSVAWNCTDGNGAAVARGVYFIRLDTQAARDVQKAVVTH